MTRYSSSIASRAVNAETMFAVPISGAEIIFGDGCLHRRRMLGMNMIRSKACLSINALP